MFGKQGEQTSIWIIWGGSEEEKEGGEEKEKSKKE